MPADPFLTTIPTHCTKCGARLESRDGQFYIGGRSWKGLVCPNGHGLWRHPDDDWTDPEVYRAKCD